MIKEEGRRCLGKEQATGRTAFSFLPEYIAAVGLGIES